jgi:glutaconyl-CoA/methylmalonyl-CoA decarboxylase subunit gamma
MQRKFKITVDGRQYDVTVEEVGDVSSLPYFPQGAPYLGAAPVPHWNAPAAPAAAGDLPAARSPAEAHDVVCTLAGMVDSVLVTLGQQVSPGDQLVVIEAMKMKTPIAAPRSGKVGAIRVKAGESVETGQVLVELS